MVAMNQQHREHDKEDSSSEDGSSSLYISPGTYSSSTSEAESSESEEIPPDPRYITTPPPATINRVPVDHVLDEPHQSLFSRAISNVLSTEIAEITFAQIVDGLPLKDVAFGIRAHNHEEVDAVAKHETLCPGALEAAVSFRDGLDPIAIELPAEILQRYQGVPAGSQAFKLPFIELVAVTIHRLAVLLFQLDKSFHKGQVLTGPRLPPPYNLGYLQPRPTPFCVPSYSYAKQYPEGVAELPGYWAEDRIFGGVILFERGESGTECREVWLHSSREGTTRRPCALTTEQKSALLRFLESDQSAADYGYTIPSSPLPILLDENNMRRTEPEISIPEDNIYRDRWERRTLVTDFKDYVKRSRHGRCFPNTTDYPHQRLSEIVAERLRQKMAKQKSGRDSHATTS